MTWLSGQVDKEVDAAATGRTKSARRLAICLFWAVVTAADVTNRHSGMGRALLGLVSVVLFIGVAMYAVVLLRARSSRRHESAT